MVLGEALHGIEGSLAQPGFMGAAGRGRDQVDVGFTRQIALGAPADCPRRARAGREVFVASRRVLLGGEERRGQFAFELLGEVLPHAVGKTPGLCFAAFDRQRDFEAGQKHGLAAQQTLQFGDGDVGRIEELRVRPGAYACSAGSLGRVAGALQRLGQRPAGESDLMPGAIAGDFHLQART